MGGDTARAAALLKKAMQMQAQMGDPIAEAKCMHMIAQVELKGMDMNKGMAALEKATAMFENAGDVKGQGDVLDTLVELHLQEGRYMEAKECARKKVTIFHDVDTRMEAQALQ